MRKAGRPKADIDWDHVGEMLQAGASVAGIAATIGCTTDTLYNRCKSDNNLDFSLFCQQKKAKGDEMLRVKQFEVAMDGDKVMLVWLGKNRLGQSDKQDIAHTQVSPEQVAQIFIDRLVHEKGWAESDARSAAIRLYPEISNAVN